MPYIPYRTRVRLRKLAVALVIIVVLLLLTAIGFVIYLQRFLVYSADGVRLEFSPSTERSAVREKLEPLPDAQVVVDTSPMEDTSAMTRLEGIYVTTDMLDETDAILEAVQSAEGQVAVLLDVKSIYGNFCYSTAIPGAETSSSVDVTAVDQLIADLNANGRVYLIARLPAFRDSAYALANQSCGLPLDNGALWMDSDSCYWLDPANQQVLSYLQSILSELAGLGFEEVVLSDFTFPSSQNIAYDGDRVAAVLDAAQRLSSNQTESSPALSMATTDPALAAYADRVYLTSSDGSQVQDLVDTFSDVYDTLHDRVVFLTDSRDTRFSDYGVLRPAVTADDEE